MVNSCVLGDSPLGARGERGRQFTLDLILNKKVTLTLPDFVNSTNLLKNADFSGTYCL
ncbi:hypothetical protein SAMN03080601_02847 [Alkalitalea saponilacus]|uniref:Uncharacterized protein n=1 Tax=Alkalitalea saponilacus TaxID=889453 RepID=A0A1T5HSR5_9BACT|nr:hypothetical protein SAMN03080601_02847 [Alkalitalea saponilacus]